MLGFGVLKIEPELSLKVDIFQQIRFPAMCNESHWKLAESIWGMLLDFSAALFKGTLLDGATSPFASQVSGWRKVEVRKALSWDWRHPQHNTPVFRYLSTAVFIFSVFPFTPLSGWMWHHPPSEGQDNPHHTQTHHRVVLLKEIKDAVGQQRRQKMWDAEMVKVTQ